MKLLFTIAKLPGQIIGKIAEGLNEWIDKHFQPKKNIFNTKHTSGSILIGITKFPLEILKVLSETSTTLIRVIDKFVEGGLKKAADFTSKYGSPETAYIEIGEDKITAKGMKETVFGKEDQGFFNKIKGALNTTVDVLQILTEKKNIDGGRMNQTEKATRVIGKIAEEKGINPVLDAVSSAFNLKKSAIKENLDKIGIKTK